MSRLRQTSFAPAADQSRTFTGRLDDESGKRASMSDFVPRAPKTARSGSTTSNDFLNCTAGGGGIDEPSRRGTTVRGSTSASPMRGTSERRQRGNTAECRPKTRQEEKQEAEKEMQQEKEQGEMMAKLETAIHNTATPSLTRRYHTTSAEEIPGTTLLQNDTFQPYGGLMDDCPELVFLRLDTSQAQELSSRGYYLRACLKTMQQVIMHKKHNRAALAARQAQAQQDDPLSPGGRRSSALASSSPMRAVTASVKMSQQVQPQAPTKDPVFVDPVQAICLQLSTIPGRYDTRELTAAGYCLGDQALRTLLPVLKVNKQTLLQVSFRSCDCHAVLPNLLASLKGSRSIHFIDLACNYRLASNAASSLLAFAKQHSSLHRVGLQKTNLTKEEQAQVHAQLLLNRRDYPLPAPVAKMLQQMSPSAGGSNSSVSSGGGPLTPQQLLRSIDGFKALASVSSGCIEPETLREKMPTCYQRWRKLYSSRDPPVESVSLVAYLLCLDPSLTRANLARCVERSCEFSLVAPMIRKKVTKKLQGDMRDEIIQMFTALDADGDGVLSEDDLKKSLPESCGANIDFVMRSLGEMEAQEDHKQKLLEHDHREKQRKILMATMPSAGANRARFPSLAPSDAMLPQAALDATATSPLTEEGPTWKKREFITKKEFAHQIAEPYLQEVRRKRRFKV